MPRPNRPLLIALAALVVVALVVGGLAIGGVFDGGGNGKPAPNRNAATYSPTFKTAFVDSCAKSALSKAQCQCIIARAQEQFTRQDFIAAIGRAQKGTASPQLRQVFVSCGSG